MGDKPTYIKNTGKEKKEYMVKAVDLVSHLPFCKGCGKAI